MLFQQCTISHYGSNTYLILLRPRYVQFSRELEAGQAGRAKDAADAVLQELSSVDFLVRA